MVCLGAMAARHECGWCLYLSDGLREIEAVHVRETERGREEEKGLFENKGR